MYLAHDKYVSCSEDKLSTVTFVFCTEVMFTHGN